MKRRKAYLEAPRTKLRVPVHVTDTRVMFGRPEHKCVPLHSINGQWFSADRVEFVDKFIDDAG